MDDSVEESAQVVNEELGGVAGSNEASTSDSLDIMGDDDGDDEDNDDAPDTVMQTVTVMNISPGGTVTRSIRRLPKSLEANQELKVSKSSTKASPRQKKTESEAAAQQLPEVTEASHDMSGTEMLACRAALQTEISTKASKAYKLPKTPTARPYETPPAKLAKYEQAESNSVIYVTSNKGTLKHNVYGLEVGQTFMSWPEFLQRKTAFCERHSVKLTIHDSHKLHPDTGLYDAVLRPYDRVYFKCFFGPARPTSSTGARERFSLKYNCPFLLRVNFMVQIKSYVISKLIPVHNHECDASIIPKSRRYNKRWGALHLDKLQVRVDDSAENAGETVPADNNHSAMMQ